MSKSQRRLGRGLSSLISMDRPTLPGTVPEQDQLSAPPVLQVGVQLVRSNPYQPRTEIDASRLEELAASIRQTGVLQPLLVRRRGDRFEIIAGERRLRAARLAGRATVPVIVREADEQQMLEMALIENIQRDDLNPIDRANAYRQCCTAFGVSVQELADRLGEDRTTVSNILRLLDLPQAIKDLVAGGELSMGHARCLLGIPVEARQVELARKAIDEGWPVRKMETVARAAKVRPTEPPAGPAEPRRRPQLVQLEQRLAAALQTRVRIIEGRRRHTGRLVIDYYSLNDFDRITQRFGLALDDWE